MHLTKTHALIAAATLSGSLLATPSPAESTVGVAVQYAARDVAMQIPEHVKERTDFAGNHSGGVGVIIDTDRPKVNFDAFGILSPGLGSKDSSLLSDGYNNSFSIDANLLLTRPLSISKHFRPVYGLALDVVSLNGKRSHIVDRSTPNPLCGGVSECDVTQRTLKSGFGVAKLGIGLFGSKGFEGNYVALSGAAGGIAPQNREFKTVRFGPRLEILEPLNGTAVSASGAALDFQAYLFARTSIEGSVSRVEAKPQYTFDRGNQSLRSKHTLTSAQMTLRRDVGESQALFLRANYRKATERFSIDVVKKDPISMHLPFEEFAVSIGYGF